MIVGDAVVSASVCSPAPCATASIVVPAGSGTGVGVGLASSLPLLVVLPNCPYVLTPNAYIWPTEVTARLSEAPAEM